MPNGTSIARNGFASVVSMLLVLFTNASYAQNTTNAGAPPDVLGLRIGMSPDQARAIFKSRILELPDFKKSYQEKFAILSFNLSGVGQQQVQNGKFLQSIEVGKVGLIANGLFVAFAPLPGQETIVWLDKRDEIPANERTTFEVFYKSLVEKYGMPTEGNLKFPRIFSWHYNQSNVLLKPGSIKARQASTGGTVCQFGLSNVDLMVRVPQFGFGNKYEQLPDECGATVVSVELRYPGGSFNGPNTPIVGYSTRLVGFDAYILSIKGSHAIVDKARSTAEGESTNSARTKKPNL